MSTSEKLSVQRARLTPAQQALLASRLKGTAASEDREPALVRSADPAARAALSFAQRRQWFLWKLDPDSTAYHIAEGLRLRGALDIEALRAAFQALLARHESLRTVFRAGEDGLAEQVVQPSLALEIPVIDLSDAPEPLRAELVEEAARAANQKPFDLLRGPLLRVSVIRESEFAHVLVVVMHHIVSDGWSMQILVDEFVAQYRAISQGEAVELPSLPVQYADYAAWQRQWLDAGERERQLAYWRSQLGMEQPVLQLPSDHPRKAEGGYRAAGHVVELPAALAQGLRRQMQARGATPFMLLLAGFQALLHRYTGQEDIRVGVPVANRNRTETEGVIGFFVNTQVLRSPVHGRMGLARLLAQARETALGAQAHQDLPFEQLVEALQPERSMGHSPLFQVMFNYLRGGYEALRNLPGLTMEGCSLGEKAAQFELTLTAIEDPEGGIKAVFGYARELFEPDTIARMAGHYLALLQALVDAPEQAVGDVVLRDQAAAPQRGLNALRFADAQPVHRLIERQVQLRPDAVALTCGARALTYAQLNERANRLAHRLIASGAGPEKKVGIVMERDAGMVVSVLAVLKSGAAYVPLDPEHPQDRLAYMAADSGLSLLLTQSSLQDRIADDAGIRVLAIDRPFGRARARSRSAIARGAPGLRDLHLRLHGQAQGRDGAPRGVVALHPQHAGHAGHDGRGRAGGGDLAVLRHRGAGAVPAAELWRAHRAGLAGDGARWACTGATGRGKRCDARAIDARGLAAAACGGLACGTSARVQGPVRRRGAAVGPGRGPARPGRGAVEHVRPDRDHHLVQRAARGGWPSRHWRGHRGDATACARCRSAARAAGCGGRALHWRRGAGARLSASPRPERRTLPGRPLRHEG